MSIDYKYKLHKYKTKYFNSIEQNGGKPIWFDNFYEQLTNINDLIKNQNLNMKYALTGTSSIALLLYNLNMTEQLDEFTYPSDINYLYVSDNNDILPPNFGNYTKYLEKDLKIPTSISNDKITCYIDTTPNEKNKITKINFIRVKNMKYFTLNDFNIVNIRTLLNMFLFNQNEKNVKKIKLIEKICQNIKKNNLYEKYGFYKK